MSKLKRRNFSRVKKGEEEVFLCCLFQSVAKFAQPSSWLFFCGGGGEREREREREEREQKRGRGTSGRFAGGTKGRRRNHLFFRAIISFPHFSPLSQKERRAQIGRGFLGDERRVFLLAITFPTRLLFAAIRKVRISPNLPNKNLSKVVAIDVIKTSPLAFVNIVLRIFVQHFIILCSQL